jgi:hypothetical protein
MKLAGKTQAQVDATVLEAKRADIHAQITALEAKGGRAMRAIVLGNASSADTAKLAEIDAQIVALRSEL